MTLREHQSLFAQDVARLIQYIYTLPDYSCSLGEAYRTKEQAEIYAKQGKGIKNSLHCERLAIDINLFLDGYYLSHSKDYERLGCFWESLDSKNRWGGKFKRADGNHFERNI